MSDCSKHRAKLRSRLTLAIKSMTRAERTDFASYLRKRIAKEEAALAKDKPARKSARRKRAV